ncbi:MAG: hypothetical protein R6V61_07325 [Wenzhouxiangellaceae bacterium]
MKPLAGIKSGPDHKPGPKEDGAEGKPTRRFGVDVIQAGFTDPPINKPDRGRFLPVHEDSEHHRAPPLAVNPALKPIQGKIGSARSERVPGGDRWSAGTAVDTLVHEDSEHHRAPSGARAVALKRFFQSLPWAKSG